MTSGFQCDQLLAMYKTRGLSVLELQVRTAFLGQMAGQSRQVVDNMVRATRMVVEYFRYEDLYRRKCISF